MERTIGRRRCTEIARAFVRMLGGGCTMYRRKQGSVQWFNLFNRMLKDNVRVMIKNCQEIAYSRGPMKALFCVENESAAQEVYRLKVLESVARYTGHIQALTIFLEQLPSTVLRPAEAQDLLRNYHSFFLRMEFERDVYTEVPHPWEDLYVLYDKLRSLLDKDLRCKV